LSNLEYDLPITPTTTLEIGSMSNQFTATASCCWRRMAGWRSATTCGGTSRSCRATGHVITLRHPLHQTGGLCEYDALLSLSGWDEADAATEDEALRLVTLQRVTGQTLAAFSKQRISCGLSLSSV
jgi:hypothetical protein